MTWFPVSINWIIIFDIFFTCVGIPTRSASNTLLRNTKIWPTCVSEEKINWTQSPRRPRLPPSNSHCITISSISRTREQYYWLAWQHNNGTILRGLGKNFSGEPYKHCVHTKKLFPVPLRTYPTAVVSEMYICVCVCRVWKENSQIKIKSGRFVLYVLRMM